MSDVIDNAGLQSALVETSASTAPAATPRRQAIALVRTALRKHDATDEEVDDALEALLELAKE